MSSEPCGWEAPRALHAKPQGTPVIFCARRIVPAGKHVPFPLAVPFAPERDRIPRPVLAPSPPPLRWRGNRGRYQSEAPLLATALDRRTAGTRPSFFLPSAFARAGRNHAAAEHGTAGDRGTRFE